MTKTSLLTILNNSILRCDIRTHELYTRFYPLIERRLQSVEKLGSLPVEFSSGAQWDFFLRTNSEAAIEEKFQELLRQLHLMVVRTSKDEIPTGEEQARMREHAAQTILQATLSCYTPGEKVALEAAASTLRGMVFPKRDGRVVSCYLAIMEAADDLFADATMQEPIARIVAATDAWKTCAKG